MLILLMSEGYENQEKKAVKKIRTQLLELREAGFDDREAFALLPLAIQLSERKG